jgi:signal transduction histidine kinase/ligand-binding sensor domain-containing protein
MPVAFAICLFLLQAFSGSGDSAPRAGQEASTREESTSFAAAPFINPNRIISERWTMEDGLPVNSIIDIEQDHHGFLWLTTYDGIVRFDGQQFTNYNTSTQAEIPANRFRFVYHDKKNDDIWFTLQYGGVMRFRQGKFTFFGREDGFGSASTKSNKPFYWQDKLIFPTQDGIYAFDQEEQRVYPLPHSGIPFEFIHNAITGTDGRLYVHTDTHFFSYDERLEATAYTLDGELFTGSNIHYFNDEILFIHESGIYTETDSGQLAEIPLDSRHRIFNGVSSAGGKLFITSYEGLSILDPQAEEEEQFIAFNFSNIGGIHHIYPFSEDRFLFHTWHRGELFLLGETGITPLAESEQITESYSASRVFKDRDQQTWLATNFRGLVRLNPAQVHQISPEDGLTSGSVVGIFEDRQQQLWINTRAGETMRISPGDKPEKVSFNIEADIFDIYSFAGTDDGSLYATLNRHGIAKRSPGEAFRLLDLPLPLQSVEQRALLPDVNGGMWVGLWGGLYKLKDDELQPFPHQETFDGLLVQYLALDTDGALWVGTAQSGVFRLHEDQLQQFTTTEGLGNNSVRGIYPDRYAPGTVWLATEGGGLSRYREGRLQTVSSAQGLHMDLLHNITEDYRGRLWMSTNFGIFFVQKQHINEVMDGQRRWFSSQVFGEKQGMDNAEGNGGYQNSFFLREDGYLLYATQGGVAFFDTNTIIDTTEEIRTVIEEFSHMPGDKNVRYAFPEKVMLQPQQNDFTISYTGISFKDPENLRFRYKLEGYDNDWIEAGKIRTASYTNMPPGSYTFKVQAGNTALNEEAGYASVDITVPAAFFQTDWFFMMCALLAAGLVYGGYRYRLRRYEAQEQELTRKIETRTAELEQEKEAAVERTRLIGEQASELRELNAVKDKFFSIVAHDLRSPFSGIHGLLEVLHNEAARMSPREREELISTLYQSSESYKRLLQNLLSWSRLQMKHATPEPVSLNAVSLIRNVCNIFDSSLKRKKLRLEIVHDHNPLWVQADKNMMHTVVRNLLSNAIKFSYKGSFIHIRSFAEKETACIVIRDFGTGIDAEKLDNLFTLEKTTSEKGTSNETGTGLGLILCKDMLSAMGGSIHAVSTKGKGSTFTVRIPVDGSF